MRSFGSYENEVPLSQHKLDLVYASVFREFFEVTFECRDSIHDTGFVPDAMISVKVVRDFTVIPRDMNRLVVFPDNRLALLCVRRECCLRGPVGLSVSALIGRSVHGGESPVLDNQAVLKPENVEEHVSSGSLPLSLGNEIG